MGSRGPLFLLLECSSGTVCCSARAGKQRDCSSEGRGTAFLLWVFSPFLPLALVIWGHRRAWGGGGVAAGGKVREGRENSEEDQPLHTSFLLIIFDG